MEHSPLRVIELDLTTPRGQALVDLLKLRRIFNRWRLCRARLSRRHKLEHPALNHCLAEMIVQMPHELLPRIELSAAKQFFDALDDGTSFFARIRIGHRRGSATLKREQQQADLIV